MGAGKRSLKCGLLGFTAEQELVSLRWSPRMYFVLLFVCDVAVIYPRQASNFQFFFFVCLFVSLPSAGTAGIHYTWLTISFWDRVSLWSSGWLSTLLCRPGSLRTHRDPSTSLLRAGAEGVFCCAWPSIFLFSLHITGLLVVGFHFETKSQHVVQAGLEFAAILLPPPPDPWNYKHVPPCLILRNFYATCCQAARQTMESRSQLNS